MDFIYFKEVFLMKNYDEAVTQMLEMFSKKDFPQKMAFTIIRKATTEPVLPSDSWSLTNRLIMQSIGETLDARTYKQWQQVERYVQKGAKAFHIYAPRFSKKVDENNNEKLELSGFMAVPVFAIEHTKGKPIEYPDYTPPVLPPLLNVAEALGIKVIWRPVSNGAFGIYNTIENKITLSCHDYSVYYHELAHAINSTFEDLSLDKDKAEIVAETTASVLSVMTGITGHEFHSYEYIKAYCEDKSQKGILSKITEILTTVEKIINIVLATLKQPKLTH